MVRGGVLGELETLCLLRVTGSDSFVCVFFCGRIASPFSYGNRREPFSLSLRKDYRGREEVTRIEAEAKADPGGRVSSKKEPRQTGLLSIDES